jgi:hypothetical protein
MLSHLQGELAKIELIKCPIRFGDPVKREAAGDVDLE